jgi:cytochrome c
MRLVTQGSSFNVMDPMMRIMLSAFVGAFLITTTSQAQEPRVQRGRTFAQTHCASCHAIGPVGESPLRTAPPFRTLHLRYPVEDLAESLAEGIMTAHRAMPQFQLDSGQIVDLIAYLKSLEP